MNRTIWKFQLDISSWQDIDMPEGAEPISAAMQDGVLCVWAKVNPDAPRVSKVFAIIATGATLPPNGNFIATVHDHPYVWHVFEIV